MEYSLVEWMTQITEKAPKPIAGFASWLAFHIYLAITRPNGGWIHFLIVISMSVIIPTVTLITSFQENVEWILRVLGLLVGIFSAGFTLVISWPKVKTTCRKIFATKRRKR